jgi:two-component system NarL family sensor kinase
MQLLPYRKFFLLSIFLFGRFLSATAYAQTVAADPLEQSLQDAATDSSRVKIMVKLAIRCFRSDPEKAKGYARRILPLAVKVKDYKEEARGYNILGVVLATQGRFDSAFDAYSHELAVANEHNDEAIRTKTIHNTGLAYYYKSDYNKALEFQLKALKSAEETHDSLLAANCLSDIGNIYYRLDSKPQALEFYEKGLAICETLQDESGIANALNSMGAVYSDMGMHEKAIQCYERSLELKRKLKDQFGILNTLINVGTVYSDLNNDSKSIEYFMQAYAISTQLDDKPDMAISLINASNAYRHKKDYAKSVLYGKMALTIADSVSALLQQREASKSLSLSYEYLHDFEQAYKYHKRFVLANDSVINEGKNKQLALMQTKFDTQKKEKENLLLKEQNVGKDLLISRQNTQRIILVSLLIILSIAALLVYNRYRSKQREMMAAEIIKQQELRSKAIIESEEKERIRISRDLHDGVGQILSAAKLNISALESSLVLPKAEQQVQMKNVLDLLDQSARELRAVSHNLMPNALLKSGLAAAVAEFLDRIGDSDKLKVSFQVTGLDERLAGTMETILYRVIQEIVANVIRHAQASLIHVQIIRHEQELVLMVEDDGVGFDVSGMTDFTGIGLRNIESRIAYLNGNIDFDSSIGKGTTVTVEVPL